MKREHFASYGEWKSKKVRKREREIPRNKKMGNLLRRDVLIAGLDAAAFGRQAWRQIRALQRVLIQQRGRPARVVGQLHTQQDPNRHMTHTQHTRRRQVSLAVGQSSGPTVLTVEDVWGPGRVGAPAYVVGEAVGGDQLVVQLQDVMRRVLVQQARVAQLQLARRRLDIGQRLLKFPAPATTPKRRCQWATATTVTTILQGDTTAKGRCGEEGGLPGTLGNPTRVKGKKCGAQKVDPERCQQCAPLRSIIRERARGEKTKHCLSERPGWRSGPPSSGAGGRPSGRRPGAPSVQSRRGAKPKKRSEWRKKKREP